MAKGAQAYDGASPSMYQGEGPDRNTSTGGGETNEWLKLAKDAYRRSTSYFDANYRKNWEDDLRMFQSKHPRDSKYQAENYKYRSRVFRPKSRSVIRKNEATAALAFFSNPEVVSIDPSNQESREQVAGSEIMKELLQYRLTKTIPWFLMVVGGFQDAMTVGIVASMQSWKYREKTEKKKVKAQHPILGEMELEIEAPKVIEDRPWIDLLPVENVRFDPAAHWYDVVETSPYIVLQMPMYLNDVLDRMDDDGEQKWKTLPEATILQCRVEGLDPLRLARNDSREDADAITSSVNEFDVVMVHLNFIRQKDETYAYYTLKDQHLLTEPMLVQEMFLHCKDGRPPVTIGFCVVETHKAVPSSLIGLGSELQREANEVANQRLDNVKYVLNKRTLVRRGANVDIEGLLRNVPGGVVMVNNVENDVREVDFQDVTSSSYQEQDRINVDFDELLGNFAQGSVLTNRKLNETVGGMRIMAQGANMLTEYTIRVFVETWAEPVLRQLMKMEQAYETDEVILNLVGQKAKLFQKFGINQITDNLLTQELSLTVNVGMGATDPDTRLQRFANALGLYNKIANEASPDLELPEIRKELFSLSSFRDSLRFFKDKVDPVVIHAQKAIQQAQQEAQKFVEQHKDKMIKQDMALDDRERQQEIEQIRLDTEKKMLQLSQQTTQNDTAMYEARSAAMLKAAEVQFDISVKNRMAQQEAKLAEREQAHEFALQERAAAHDLMLAEQEQAWKDRLAAEKVASERKLTEAKATKIKSAVKDKKTGKWTIEERSA